MRSDTLELIADIFERRGAEAYLGEPVTISEHMLQCAMLAEATGAPDGLVAAALLHDIGHFTSEFGAYAADDDIDNHHDAAGARVLEDAFPPLVTDCIRLHVAAKRYLCATHPGYHARLSAASQHSLALQGGPMDDVEVTAFRNLDFHQQAIRVRLWDDRAKALGAAIKPFSAFMPLLRRVAL